MYRGAEVNWHRKGIADYEHKLASTCSWYNLRLHAQDVPNPAHRVRHVPNPAPAAMPITLAVQFCDHSSRVTLDHIGITLTKPPDPDTGPGP